MPKVFVHGNPETSAIWRALFDDLKDRGVDDIVALSPPGFGAAVPVGFEPTQVGYRDWLIREIQSLGAGVDLVGHDWGAGHVYGVLAERPDLLRSWAADCAGLVHPDYVWHDAALAWQTPEVGEQTIAAMFEMPVEQRAETWASLGIVEISFLAGLLVAAIGVLVSLRASSVRHAQQTLTIFVMAMFLLPVFALRLLPPTWLNEPSGVVTITGNAPCWRLAPVST